MKIEFSKGLAVTVAGLMAVIIAGQFVLFLKLQSLQKDIVGLQLKKTGFELSLPNEPPEEFPPFLSQGISSAELENSETSHVNHHSELQPPLELEGTEKAKPLTGHPAKSQKIKSLLSEEEKQKIWQEAFRNLDAESVKDLLKMRNAIERSSPKKKTNKLMP